MHFCQVFKTKFTQFPLLHMLLGPLPLGAYVLYGCPLKRNELFIQLTITQIETVPTYQNCPGICPQLCPSELRRGSQDRKHALFTSERHSAKRVNGWHLASFREQLAPRSLWRP